MSIKTSTFANAAVTAKDLSARSIFLTTRHGSVLGELMEVSTSFQSPKTTDAASILLRPAGSVGPVVLRTAEELGRDAEMNTGNGEDMSIHSLKIAALAADLAPVISAHISHARNVVSPMVVELAQKLEKFKETAKPLDPASSFEIVKGVIPALLLDESFLSDGIATYSSIDAKAPDYISIDEPATDDLISSMMNLGNDRLNGLVAAWLKTKEENFFKNCYLINFTSKLVPGYVGDAYADYGLSHYTRGAYRTMDIALACYLIASRLFVEPKSVPGLSLAAYKEKVRGWIDYAGSTAMKAAKTAARQQEAGTLVSEAVLSKKCIVVNNVVYQSWLQAGGSPEVLLGMLVSGQVQYSVAAIEENRETLLRHWQNYLMLAKSDVASEMTKRFKNYLENEVMVGLNELTQSEQDYATHFVQMKTIIAERVKKEIEAMSHCLMDDVYQTALCMIAKARFFYTSSYQILNEMTLVAKQNPDIDVREAALLSVISYIADYYVGQVEIVK